MAHGIFPNQKSSLCPLNWQVDSYLLGHNVVLVSGVHQNGSFVLLCFAFDDEEEVVAVVSAILFPDT